MAIKKNQTVQRNRREKYLQSKGLKCPYCGCICLTTGDTDTQDDAIYRGVTCQECNKEWTDIYTLTDVTF